MNEEFHKEVKNILKRITMNCLGVTLSVQAIKDKTYGSRIYLQVYYKAPCTKTKENSTWYGRKWYLSEFMIKDEIVKTAYAAFEAAIKHEIMEGFKVDGKILFNPHINFEELLKISDKEVNRDSEPKLTNILNNL